MQRVNHQNQFVPKAVLTRTGKIQVNTARTSGTNTVNYANRQAVSTNAARKVNTVKPIVNNARPKAGFHKTLSPFRKPFNRTTTLRTNFSYQKVNTAEVNAVSVVKGKRETTVKPSAGCNWRHKRHYWNKVFKYNGGSSSRNYDYPQRALQNKGIVDSGCSRHMTGNKAYLAEYQDFNGGPVAFGGSKGYITGKGKIKTRKLDFEDAMRCKKNYNISITFLCHKCCDKKNKFKLSKSEVLQDTEDLLLQAGAAKASSTNTVNTASTPVSTASPYGGLSFTDTDQDDSEIPALEDMYDHPTDGIFTNASYDDEGAVADFTNLETIVNVSPIPTSRINSIHPSTLILGDPNSAVQTRSKVTKSSGAHAFVSYIQKQRRNNHKDFQHCLFACFLSQNKPKKISEALEDENLPYRKKAIGTKWVYKNKKDERGVVVRNKARLVARDIAERRDRFDSFAPVAKIEAIRIFLAFASYMGFIVYQMDMKSAFLYSKIDEEVYVSQPPGFIDPKYPKKVYKVVKALYFLHQATRAWYATLSTFLLKSGYKRRTIDKTLFIKKDKNDIMLVQVYVDDIIFGSTKKSWCDEFEALIKSRFQMKILKKFDFASVKTASTPIETQKPLVKDEEASDVDVHLYRSMIGSLMYLTASRPDIMFAVCACSRFQVTPKTSHLNAVKRIFRYLKGKPKLGLWYPRVSSFDLEAYSDSDYTRANLDRIPTTGGCQFLGRRLISWQCKKQTIVATSTTEAEYVAAANCYGQVLWIQNQMLDYGFNFMNTKIYIDNED
ncbi:putative ribonuclease H-like domain-containing protein [Tanacetum coccineum]|uniref:Ribonuclease H-like domain-containing protein n=1 Tax=Tanacetum coccineum TaxID=301880 RepID=A0ABQ5DFH3_9ASTR